MSQKLTPDIVGKVIRADLKNIIDKVGSGRPLSGVERGIFDTLNLTGEDLTKKRQLSLLSKWANGKRLNDSELGEIESLLPEGSIEEEKPVEPVTRKLRSTGYYEIYKFYQDLYGCSARTLKRWISDGKEASPPDICPLDYPDQMRSWWARNMEKPCPAKIQAAAVQVLKKQHAEKSAVATTPAAPTEVLELPIVAPEPVAEESTAPQNLPRELLPVGDHEVGLNATLGRLRNTEVQVSRIMTEALEAGDEGKASAAMAQWTKITTQVRQVEKDARAEAEALGHLIPRNYAEQKIVEYHTAISRGTRGMYRRMCEVMRIPIDAETEAAWIAECDVLFIHFQEEVFT